MSHEKALNTKGENFYDEKKKNISASLNVFLLFSKSKIILDKSIVLMAIALQ